MPDQRSPQEREIDRFRFPPGGGAHLVVPGLEECNALRDAAGKWVRFTDHRAALQDREAEHARKEQIRESEVVEAHEHRSLHEELRRKAEDRANRAEAALKWAIGWIEACSEIPVKDDEAEDHAQFLAAKAVLDALDTSIEDPEAGTSICDVPDEGGLQAEPPAPCSDRHEDRMEVLELEAEADAVPSGASGDWPEVWMRRWRAEDVPVIFGLAPDPELPAVYKEIGDQFCRYVPAEPEERQR